MLYAKSACTKPTLTVLTITDSCAAIRSIGMTRSTKMIEMIVNAFAALVCSRGQVSRGVCMALGSRHPHYYTVIPCED